MFNKSKLLAVLLAMCALISVFSLSLNASAVSNEDLINSLELNPVRTGYRPLDKAVDDIFNKIFTPGMTTYDKVKAIYDYMIYHYAGGSGSNYSSATAPDLSIDYSLGSIPSYYSSLDRRIAANALKIIETHKGTCLHYTAATIVFFKAIGLDVYEMHGVTAMAAGGMGNHYWPIVIINGTQYIFDAQVDDHIANGGATKYWRFFISVADLSSKYVVSGSAREQMENFLSFSNPDSSYAKINKLILSPGDSIKTGDAVVFSADIALENDTQVFCSFYVAEDALNSSASIVDWQTLSDKSEKTSVIWFPDRAGRFTLKLVVKDKKNLSVLDSSVISVNVSDSKPQSSDLLSASAGAIYLSDVITLTVNAASVNKDNSGNTSAVTYTYAYTVSGSDIEHIIKENTTDTRIAFTPRSIGKYFIKAYVADSPKTSGKATVELDVLSKEQRGDVNFDGKISISDARLALRAAVGIDAIEAKRFLVSDIDEDGKVSISDGRTILRAAVGIEEFK